VRRAAFQALAVLALIVPVVVAGFAAAAETPDAGAPGAAAEVQGGQERQPLLEATVTFANPLPGSVPALVEFEADFHPETVAPPLATYLANEKGNLYACQVEAIRGEAGAESARARFAAVLPRVNARYFFVTGPAGAPQSDARVSSVLMQNSVTLDTGGAAVRLRTGRFVGIDEATVAGEGVVPAYFDGLVNRQQSIRMTVTDRFRHADFEMRAEMTPESFALERRGPVVAEALYRGEFAARETVKPIPFEARISLGANGVAGAAIALLTGSYDADTYRIKEISITLPLVLERAASLSFGGRQDETDGRSFWTGEAVLTVAANGAARFTEGDGGAVMAKGPITWADYSDGDKGVGIMWEAKGAAVNLAVEYREDLVTLTFFPPDVKAPVKPLEVKAFYLFHRGRRGSMILAPLAEDLTNPPTVSVSDEILDTGAEIKSGQ